MNDAVPDKIPVKKSEHVRAMFGAIAHRYDFLNHFLSLNIDQRWRRVTVEQIVRKLGRPDFNALDLACGTGDLTAALRRVTSGRVVGMDFCHPMLVIGLKKCFKSDPPADISLAEADALQLPVRDSSFDAVSIAFGLRNLEDYREGLREMNRVLRPGGVLAVLEFSRPGLPVFRHFYQFYFSRILPRLGAWFSGVAGPYTYLPDSVSKFPNQEELKALMESVGFSDVEYSNLTGGIAALHLGTK
jgi:demethylmenaquinone methyltransferase/2-methoxy-6-polyprenyl-1,4-benzoquinol methylase